jgi:hypothetical protein
MNNKDFYYIKGHEQIGPISFEELKELNLEGNTLVWFDDLKDWSEINNIPNLLGALEKKKSPPPIPSKEENLNKAEVSRDVELNKEKTRDEISEPIKLTPKILQLILIWIGINSLALITSYSEIAFFSNDSPRSDEFWPFVKIFEFHDRPSMWGIIDPRPEASWEFHGIFYRYDWTEFLVYVGGAFLIFLFNRLSKKDEARTNAKY